ncbi:uncharacterized protein FIBRA_03447 [Fibroporia radiculosa]|uniref:Uncharacterized protein n=1 Tax=Fibroporia radiculosa TaxID=599839 RepID=J4I9M0_9APHY|nr:uncharacterized protein FIBRA_03447 [Fibroporia radiculosa]CCM01396.1 predicted protein [Fibroporia radiculosa]
MRPVSSCFPDLFATTSSEAAGTLYQLDRIYPIHLTSSLFASRQIAIREVLQINLLEAAVFTYFFLSAMHADPEFQQNHDCSPDADTDSLFGSPPPSPSGRGRLRSLLALPGAAGSAQNVGTLALPGSHLVAEAPVHPPAYRSSSACGTNVSQPPRPLALQPSLEFNARPNPTPTSSTRSLSVDAPPMRVQRKSRKGKEKATSAFHASTPRPPAPPIELPSADEPLPPNFLRNQQALLGLAGLVSGVNPAQLSMQRGSSAHNPIVIDDDAPVGGGLLTSQPPSISRHPASATFAPSQLSPPSGEDLVAAIMRQKNVFPVIESLLRLLSGISPAAPPPPRFASRRAEFGRSESETAAPPLKRRKLNQVPAGATDWDVPYPFQDGQGPQGYQTSWARDRARALLADLAVLVQDAKKKAAVRGYYQQQEKERRRRLMEQRGETIKKYYRAKTAFYGIDMEKQASQDRLQEPTGVHVLPSRMGTPNTKPSDHTSEMQRQSMSEPPQVLASADLRAASTLLLQQSSNNPAPSQTPSNTSSMESSTLPSPSSTTADNMQSFFDEWLSLLDTFQPGDPNEAALSTGFDGALDEFVAGIDLVASTSATATSATATSALVPFVAGQQPGSFTTANTPVLEELIPDFLIDPVLFGLPSTSVTHSVQSSISSTPSSRAELPAGARAIVGIKPLTDPTPADLSSTRSVTASGMEANTTNTGPPSTPTPTSVDLGSPLTSTVSLADQEHEPVTPDWAWAFGDQEIFSAGGAGRIASDAASSEEGTSFLALLNRFGAGVHGFVGPTDGPFGVAGNEGVDMEKVRELEKVLDKTYAPLDAQMHADSALPATLLPSSQELSAAGGPAVDMDMEPAVSEQTSAEFSSTIVYHQNGTENSSRQDAVRPGGVATDVQISPAEEMDLPGEVQFPVPILPLSTDASQPGPHLHSTIALRDRDQRQAGLNTHHTLQAQAHSGIPTESSSSSYAALTSLLSLAVSPTSVASSGSGSGAVGKQTRAEILGRARALKAELEKARERTRVELWEMTVEQGCLVGLGKELGAPGGESRSGDH